MSSPVQTCDKNDGPLSNPGATSGCDGGSAFACSNTSPWAVSDELAYGFAATSIAGGNEASWCCACYKYVRPGSLSCSPTPPESLLPPPGLTYLDRPGCSS